MDFHGEEKSSMDPASLQAVPGNTAESALFKLQQTLYTSKNPTRRWLHTSRYTWLCEAIRRHSVSGGRALEAGPGSGIYLPVLSELFATVDAVDIEKEYLEGIRHLQSSLANVTLRTDDITHSSYPDNTFDLVLCTEVVEHIPDSASALKEIHRLLKPGGHLILSTPQPFSPLELAAKIAFLPGIAPIVRLAYREPVLDLGHVNLLSAKKVTAQLSNAGFTITERHKSGVYLPLCAELFGEAALAVEKRLETAVRGNALDFLLWTQYYIAVA